MVSPETLRRYPLFGGLGPDVLKAIAMFGEDVSYQQGQWLFQEGDPADTLFLVLDGVIELTANLSPNGSGPQLSTLVTRNSGEVIGWSALVPPHTFTLGGRARTDARMAQFDGPAFRALLHRNSDVGYQVLHKLSQVMGERLVNLRTQLVSITAP